jgi:hypothetical protein
MTLREISENIQDFIDQNIDHETGLLSEEACKALLALEGKKEEKVLNIASYAKNMEAEKAALEEWRKSLQEREKYLQNKIEAMKYLLIFYAEGEKFKDHRVSVSWRTSQTVNILSEKDVPKKFKVIETVEKIDKNAIKSEFRNGEEVPGAELIYKNNPQIK